MAFIVTEHHTIVQRHIIIILWQCVKFFLFVLIDAALIFLVYAFKQEIVESHPSIHSFVIVPLLFGVLNYIFFRFILELIAYYQNLIIFYKDKIVLIENTLFLTSDFEVIDMYRIMRFDVLCHGLVQNACNYGTIKIEQQSSDAKFINFVPRPDKIVELLEARRSLIISERSKKEEKKEKNYWDRS